MKKLYFLLFLSISFIVNAQTPGDIAQSFGAALGFNSDVYSIAVQPDGKILVGGFFTTFNGVTENYIIRLNANGTKDTSFTTGTGFNNVVYSIAVQPDGKILVGGDFITFNGVTENSIVRLNANGTKDTSFTTGTFNIDVYSIAVQPDGKILVGGFFTTFNGVTENRIVRLNANGTKDTSIITGTGFNNAVRAITVKPDGQILIGGDFTTYKGSAASFYLIALHTETSLGTQDFTDVDAVVIFPNPVNEVLNIQTTDFTNIQAVKIIDLQGKVVLENTNDSINVSSLAKGLYIVKIITNKGEFTKKFIKE